MLHVKTEDFVAEVPVKMTRREKLLHLANLVRNFSGMIELLHGLEYFSPRELQMIRACKDYYLNGSMSPFAIAASNPVFQKDSGLSRDYSLMDVLNYLEISQDQAHEFSCDCGGHVSNEDMACRIERLA